MTVQPQGQLTTEQVVEAYRTYRQGVVDAMLRTIRAEWAAVRAGTAVADWLAGPALRVFAAIALTQEALSASSVAFTEDVLDAQGVRAVVPPLVPDAFAGYSQDSGVDLRRVLFTAPDRVDLLRRSGLSDDEALARGLGFLGMVATTETSDAARSADKVATVAVTPTDGTPRTTVGWIRVLNPPSCSRCAILAGRFYRWSSGFERHPSCFPAGTVVSGPIASAATRRWYEGELVILRTASGKQLSATGNHPILTWRGWVPARLLEEGDDLITSAFAEGAAPLVVPDERQVPSCIEDVHRALGVTLGRMPTTTQDFHGDGGHGDVDVVLADCLLQDQRVPTSGQHAGQFSLPGAGRPADPLASLGASLAALRRELHAACRIVSSASLGQSLGGGHPGGPRQAGRTATPDRDSGILEALADHRATHAVLLGEGEFAAPGFVGLDDSFDRQADLASRWDAPPGPLTMQSRAAYAERGQDLLLRLTGQVAPDRLVEKRSTQWSGHVYNLTSSEGWYDANGVIVSNCDCIHLPAPVAAAEGLLVDPQAYFESLTPAERTRLFGKANSAAIEAGADMNRVVNAATKGKVRIAADGTRWVNGRPSVWQLIKDAAGDRDEAVRLLTRAGYIRA